MFAHLSSSTAVTSFHLEDLSQGGRLIHLEGTLGKPKFPYKNRQRGPSTLTKCEGAVIGEGASNWYRVAVGRALKSPLWYRWADNKRKEYGPAAFGRTFDFVAMNKVPMDKETNTDQMIN
jgi:hypothetical protein